MAMTGNRIVDMEQIREQRPGPEVLLLNTK